MKFSCYLPIFSCLSDSANFTSTENIFAKVGILKYECSNLQQCSIEIEDSAKLIPNIEICNFAPSFG